MSYEGYIQYWCKNGHYWTYDCYGPTFASCPTCAGAIAVENSVDETNRHTQGRIEPILVEKGAKCPTCAHPIGEDTYKIPNPKTDRIFIDEVEEEPPACVYCGSHVDVEERMSPATDAYGDHTWDRVCLDCFTASPDDH